MSKISKLLISICILGAGICVIVILSFYYNRERDRQKNEELASQVMQFQETETIVPESSELQETINASMTTEVPEEDTQASTTTEASEETSEPYISPVHFDLLHDINPELYVWLKIDNTDIDFPVGEHADENDRDFYLGMGYDLKPTETGTLYSIPGVCGRDAERAIIVYGHNQSKFAMLREYRNPSFWDDHRYIDLYWETEEVRYEIFAYAQVDNYILTDIYDFSSRDGVDKFLSDIWTAKTTTSHIFAPCSADDQILILSTCVPGNTEARFIIAGRAL